MTHKFAIVAMVAATLVLNGCNIVKGVGRDVKSAGKAVERAAD
jgi:predicted small secreted protein